MKHFILLFLLIVTAGFLSAQSSYILIGDSIGVRYTDFIDDFAPTVYHTAGTHFNPDDSYSGNILLDLNGDGIHDFKISLKSDLYQWSVLDVSYNITGLSGGEILSNYVTQPYDSSTINVASHLYLHDTISGRNNFWQRIANLHERLEFPSNEVYDWGNFTTDNNFHFIGVRFPVAGDTLYGWIQIALDSFNLAKVRVADYACNADPGNYIIQFVSSVASLEDDLENLVTISPSPFNNNVSIAFRRQNFENVKLTVYDISGQVVLVKNENDINNQSSTVLDMGLQPKGMYLLEILIDGRRCLKKLVKE